MINFGWVALSGYGCAEPEPEPETDTSLVISTRGAEVEAGELVECADPGARDQAVFDRLWLGDPNYDVFTNMLVVQGLIVDDIDGDGDIDVYVPQNNGVAFVFYGDGAGGFTPGDPRLEVTTTRPPTVNHPVGNPLYFGTGGGSADLEGDGDVDLFTYESDGPLVLWRNDGAGALTAEVLQPDSAEEVGCGGSLGIADLDLDGDLDLLHGRNVDRDGAPCGSFWLEQDEAGRLVDRSADLPPEMLGMDVVMAALLPLDDDPWPELYIGSIEGLGNLVIEFDRGLPFAAQVHPLQTDIKVTGLEDGDLNNDERVDLFLPGTYENALFISSGDVWIDRAQSLGVWPTGDLNQRVGWAGELVDLDADGLLDIIETFDPVNVQPQATEPDEIFRQTAPEVFERVGAAWGWNDLDPARTAVAVDLDGNGFLDLVKRNESHVVVDLARCNANGWLGVRLEQDGRNRQGIGAEVVVSAGGVSYRRWVTAGATSFAAGTPKALHFGLGDNDQVDSIEVFWPDGGVSTVGALQARRVVTVRREGGS